MRVLWRLLVNPVSFVVLCLLWCLGLGLGSLLAYERPDLFGTMDAYPFALWLREVGRRALPHSAWVYLLAALTWTMTASLALCTVNWFWRRRRSLRALGEVLVHLGFLLIFCGFVIEAVVGTRVHGVQIAEGETVPLPQLGVTLRLARVELATSPQGEVLDTVSTLAVGRDGTEVSGTTRLNHPLIDGATVVYPRGVRRVIAAARLLTPFGRLRLAPGEAVELPGGRSLVLRGVLQADEEQAGRRGPALSLGLADPAGRLVATALLSPGGGEQQALLGGVPVALDRLDEGLVGGYDVHRDPGVKLVLIGAVVLFVGTLWAFGTYLASPRLAPAASPVSSSGA